MNEKSAVVLCVVLAIISVICGTTIRKINQKDFEFEGVKTEFYVKEGHNA